MATSTRKRQSRPRPRPRDYEDEFDGYEQAYQHAWGGSWHLDKRVPIALIVTMFVQMAAGIWWASQLNSDVSFLKNQIVSLKEDLNDKADKFEKVSTLGVELKIFSAQLNKVEKTLELLRDKITDQQIRNRYEYRTETDPTARSSVRPSD